jgi:hypothetical protein
MLGEWAMVPSDLRGVVGNRRGPSRPVRPVGHTPPQATPPIQLTHRKGSGTAGEIGATPAPEPRTNMGMGMGMGMGMEPTVQVQLDAHGVPLPAASPLAPPIQAPVTVLPPRGQTPIQLRTRVDQAARSRLDSTPPPVLKKPPSGPHARLEHTPQPRLRPTTGQHAKAATGQHLKPATGQHHAANPFDDVEADFVAREADLYKREAVETFDDLDHPLGTKPGKPRSRKR